MSMSQAIASQDMPPIIVLPELRADLKLIRGAASVLGEPSWLIHDSAQNRFIQIDPTSHRIMSLWRAGATADELISQAANRGISVALSDIENLIDFFQKNRLTCEPAQGGWRYFVADKAARRRTPGAWLVHNYLFFRVPLWRPEQFLARTLPYVTPLASRPAVMLIGALGLLGVYLVSRQWDAFTHTFQNFFTWEGALLMGVALILVKLAHELGHAYFATYFGCRVPTMGIAFILMAPLLYTDVTDAWRLRDRKKRLLIDSAGIRVELGVAALSLFLWAFLPEGPARSLAFMMSAISIFTSLAINLNPFMKFDGYYLLSEFWGVENLQSRAFALSRWKLREIFFGLQHDIPEVLPKRLQFWLILYGFCTWIYRIVLFVGIALIVYHFFFKTLGIVLFAFEIIVFILKPVWNEMKIWFSLRQKIIQQRRTWLTLGLVAAALILFFVPWSSQVEIPAIVELKKVQRVFVARPARIEALHVRQGQNVTAGQALLTLNSPSLFEDLKLTEAKLEMARMKFARRGASAEDLEATLVLTKSIEALRSKLAGLQQEQAELVLRAPFSGRILQINPKLHKGRWISTDQMIALIGEPGALVAKGYLSETDLWRVKVGAQGRFIPEHPMRPSLEVSLSDISVGAVTSITINDLASTLGGRIAVNGDDKKRLIPTVAQYQVLMPEMKMQKGPIRESRFELAARGIVLLDGTKESLAARSWRQMLKVLMREAGA